MKIFRCLQCGGEMHYIGNHQYQCEACGDVVDYTELVKSGKKIISTLFGFIKK